MSAGRPLALLLPLLSSYLAFLGLAVWAYGDPAGFFRSPARAGMAGAGLLLSLVAAFSGSSGLSRGEREDRGNRWIIAALVPLWLALAWLPPYLDGRDRWTLDGEAAACAGLALFVLGSALRLAAVFALGRRFSGLVAIQQGHRLKTDGVYRLVRHPSYAGALLATAGYVLVFRCWLGLLLAAAMLPVLVARMNAEEALLASAFGEEYAAYRRRTWRLLPWVY